ncbi:MAG: tetratricopeptide repeat protein [Myxococcota bacterium]|jgi:tetratricopeptide (TPR) repeat protein|nr:tetratricopeptide repeat protein [Myxococcota bacterium]
MPVASTTKRSLASALRVLCTGCLFWFATGCATSGPPASGRFESKDDRGFVIVQDVGIASSLRSDFRRAVRSMEDEQYAEAVELLSVVTEAAPHITVAHINLGIAQGELGELEEAERSMTRAVESNPNHPVAHNELGIIHRKRGKFEEARSSYERALDIYPGFHFARRNLAILCDLYLSDLDCALENYERYHRAVPDDAEAGIWIADLRNRTGRAAQ